MSRPRTKPLPSIRELRRRFSYDCETGLITHRERSGNDTLIAAWNRRWANKTAGTVQNGGYSFIHVGECGMLLGHRVAWAITHGEWPAQLDHKNGDKLDNRLSNLRVATRCQNRANARGHSRSGHKGVTRRGKRWTAKITHEHNSVRLGTFDTPELAHAAYCGAAKVLHGAFANLSVRLFGSISATVQFGMTGEGAA